MINGPISKRHFLNKKFLGMTEYLAKRSNKEGQEVKTGGVVLDKFGSVCKVMIEKSSSGSGYVKPQVAKPGSGEFDDDIPF